MSFDKIPDSFAQAEKFLFAAATGNIKFVKGKLQTIGFNPTVIDETGKVANAVFEKTQNYAYNALQFACFKDEKEMVILLLQDKRLRETVNYPVINGKPLLHILAGRTNSLEIIKELLHAGARTDLLDSSDMSPFTLAAFNANTAVIELFVKHEMSSKISLLDPFLTRDVIGIVLSYDQRYINLGDDKTGRNPLYYALNLISEMPKDGAEEVIPVMLKHGANPLQKVRDLGGIKKGKEETILDHCRTRLKPNIVKLLEDQAAKVKETSK